MSAFPEHAIRCPWCLAPAGQRCTTPRGRPIAVPSHEARHTAWREANPPGPPTTSTTCAEQPRTNQEKPR